MGPDLAGVTSRREASWLVRQIQEPDSLIAENDPIAMQLLQEANGVPMVRLGLTDAQVSAVISYCRASNNRQLWHRGFLSICAYRNHQRRVTDCSYVDWAHSRAEESGRKVN